MSVESLYESVLTAETGLYLNASALASALLDQVASRVHSKDLNQTKVTVLGELSLTGSMKDMITHWYIRVARGREGEVEGERRSKGERNRSNKILKPNIFPTLISILFRRFESIISTLEASRISRSSRGPVTSSLRCSQSSPLGQFYTPLKALNRCGRTWRMIRMSRSIYECILSEIALLDRLSSLIRSRFFHVSLSVLLSSPFCNRSLPSRCIHDSQRRRNRDR